MAAAQSATKRVVQYARHGPSSVLEVVTGLPLPGRKPGHVLVANHATSVNPVDYKMRQGFGGLIDVIAGPKLPAVPGGDVAGVVVDADAGSQFKPGDRVMGLMHLSRGSYASHVVLPENALAHIPDELSFEQAAAIPLAGLTAWQALELAQAKAGHRVLVHAGAGGVGVFAIQLAKARGCHVTTTCSGKNVEFVRSLGADEVIDYTQQSFEEVCKDRPFDSVLDAVVLHGYEERSRKVLKKSGTYVHFMPAPLLGQVLSGLLKGALGLGPRYRVVLVMPSGRQLAEIAALCQAGKVNPVVAEVMPLEQAGEAQDKVTTGHTRGKIILKIA